MLTGLLKGKDEEGALFLWLRLGSLILSSGTDLHLMVLNASTTVYRMNLTPAVRRERKIAAWLPCDWSFRYSDGLGMEMTPDSCAKDHSSSLAGMAVLFASDGADMFVKSLDN